MTSTTIITAPHNGDEIIFKMITIKIGARTFLAEIPPHIEVRSAFMQNGKLIADTNVGKYEVHLTLVQ